MGETDYGTYMTERLLTLNSYAVAVGFEKPPYPNLSSPTDTAHTHAEFLGFKYNFEINEVSTSTTVETGEDAELDEDGGDDGDLPAETLFRDLDLQRILEDSCAEFDIEVLFSEEEYVTAIAAQRRTANDETANLLELSEEAAQHDAANATAIEEALARLLPGDTGMESSMDAFKRLTNERPWIPFRLPDSSSPPTDIDNEEARLFDEMEVTFKRGRKDDPPPPAHKSYHMFAMRWNELVHQRFKAWCTGDENVLLPRLKSCLQLQQYYDKRQQIASLQAVLPTHEDPDRETLQQTLRANRRLLPRPRSPHTVNPPIYRTNPNAITPFGHPNALNAKIGGRIVTQAIQGVAGSVVQVPYRVALPNLPAARRPPQQRAVFRTRRYCRVCGWLRSDHNKDKEGVAESCKRLFCGKCYLLKRHHPNNSFGPQCNNPTNGYCTGNVLDWYNTVGAVSE